MYMGVFGLVFTFGCKTPDPPDASATAVATAYGAVLTTGDLQAEIPEDISVRDSARWADRIIADWHQRRALVHLAETELPEMERDFEREVA